MGVRHAPPGNFETLQMSSFCECFIVWMDMFVKKITGMDKVAWKWQGGGMGGCKSPPAPPPAWSLYYHTPYNAILSGTSPYNFWINKVLWLSEHMHKWTVCNQRIVQSGPDFYLNAAHSYWQVPGSQSSSHVWAPKAQTGAECLGTQIGGR